MQSSTDAAREEDTGSLSRRFSPFAGTQQEISGVFRSRAALSSCPGRRPVVGYRDRPFACCQSLIVTCAMRITQISCIQLTSKPCKLSMLRASICVSRGSLATVLQDPNKRGSAPQRNVLMT